MEVPQPRRAIDPLQPVENKGSWVVFQGSIKEEGFPAP